MNRVLQWSLVEFRNQPRSYYEGKVRLFPEGGPLTGIAGEVGDVSNHGFRGLLLEAWLAPGREVRFRHRFFQGKARVMWSRSESGAVETGFHILPD